MNKIFVVLLAFAFISCESDLDEIMFQNFQNSLKNTTKNIHLLMNFWPDTKFSE